MRKVILLKLLFCATLSFADVNTRAITDSLDVENVLKIFVEEKQYNHFTDLCEIMTDCGSDKGNKHNYTTIYEKLFAPYRQEKLNIFELGLGTNNPNIRSHMGREYKPGASIRGWANYFPYAQVYGADVDSNILFFDPPRIFTFYCDQTSAESIQNMYSLKEFNDMYFDIFIEDGLHEFEANYTFLINSLPKLKNGGLFIIEDLEPRTVQKFQAILQDLKEEYNLRFIQIFPVPKSSIVRYPTNTILIIQK